MASQGSKGLTKKHSPLQKQHYLSHPYRLERNKKRKLQRHIEKLRKRIKRRAEKGHVIHMDEQAVNKLKELEKRS